MSTYYPGYCSWILCSVWWAFIGGIVQVVESVKADPVSAFGIAFGITRVIFATAIGWITFMVGAMIGTAFFGSTSYKKRR